MSRIAGAYQQPDGAAVTAAMCRALTGRGPASARGGGDAGLYAYADGRVAAELAVEGPARPGGGHRRPLTRDNLAVSCDGALYNHRELRSELAAAGATFRTGSDLEVVLEAWRRWGPGCLRKFRGMFALAVFDEVSGSLYLARDQLGVKPLHFYRRRAGVVFCSELKGLREAVGSELRLDPGAVVATLLYQGVPDSRSALAPVEKLQPGTWMELRPDGSFQFRTYWDAADVAAAAAAASELPLELCEVVDDAVGACLPEGIPAESLMSGGLESSIVAVLARRRAGRLGAYTVAFRPGLASGGDGAARARAVARSSGIDLRELEVGTDVAEILPMMVGVFDEPTSDLAAVRTLLVCRAAADAGARVLLSGLGAEDLFAGRARHVACALAALDADRVPWLDADRALRLEPAPEELLIGGHGSPRASRGGRTGRLPELSEEPAFLRSHGVFDLTDVADLVHPDVRPDLDDLLVEHLETYCDNLLETHVDRMCLADARLALPGLSLAYADRAAAAASVELRFPFVDPVVFRAAFSLGGERKLRGGTGKVALREVARAWLPGRALDGPDDPAGLAVQEWLAGDLRDAVDDVLLGGHVVADGLLRAEAVRRVVDEERGGRAGRSDQVWQLLGLAWWYDQARRATGGL